MDISLQSKLLQSEVEQLRRTRKMLRFSKTKFQKLDHLLGVNLILTGLSGMLTSLVMEPTGSPLYSILNLCTTFVIMMYNSSRANRCPMQDLKWQKNICTDSSQNPSSSPPDPVAKRKV